MLKHLKSFNEQLNIDDDIFYNVDFNALSLETFKVYFENAYTEYVNDGMDSELVLSNNEYFKTSEEFVIQHLDYDDVYNKKISMLLIFKFNYIDNTVNCDFYYTISRDEKDVEYLLNNNVDHKTYIHDKKINDFEDIAILFNDVIEMMYNIETDTSYNINKTMRRAKFSTRNIINKN